MKINLPVTQTEVPFPKGRYLVSKTDLKGIITQANDAFVAISGYDRDELIGKSHNLVRHPDMPPEAFGDLWRTVKNGLPWHGLVKNRSKDGHYYWVKAFVVPVRKNGQTVGYMSVRTEPDRAQVRQAETLYRQVRENKARLPTINPGLLGRFSFSTRLWTIMGGMALLTAAITVAAFSEDILSAKSLFVGSTALLSTLTAISVGIYLALRIDRPLAGVTRFFDQIAEGNLTNEVDVSMRDETGLLFCKLGGMQVHLLAMLDDIATAAVAIEQRSTDLDQRMVQVSDHYRHCRSNQSAGPERRHRSGPGGRTGTWIRRRRRRGSHPGRAHDAEHPRHRRHHHGDPDRHGGSCRRHGGRPQRGRNDDYVPPEQRRKPERRDQGSRGSGNDVGQHFVGNGRADPGQRGSRPEHGTDHPVDRRKPAGGPGRQAGSGRTPGDLRKFEGPDRRISTLSSLKGAQSPGTTHKETPMRNIPIFSSDNHQFILLNESEPGEEDGVRSNQYLVVHDQAGVLLDPGGFGVMPRVLSELLRHIDAEQLKGIVLSHQDPDIVGSIATWLEICAAPVYVSSIWMRFLPHYGISSMQRFIGVPDEGMRCELAPGFKLELLPAHFLHSEGQINTYDPVSRILFSGDIGAATLPTGDTSPFVDDFAAHLPNIEGFHRRYMCSNRAARMWVDMVSKLDIDFIAPQHGPVYRGSAVPAFLDWFAQLECGIDLMTEAGKFKTQP